MLSKYDKRKSFINAGQSFQDVQQAYQGIEITSAGYGHDLKHLKEEVNEAYQQIQTALVNATEHQRAQLKQFEKDLQHIVDELNIEDFN